MSDTKVIDSDVDKRQMFQDAVYFITSKDFENIYERTINKFELKALLEYALSGGVDLGYLAKKDFSKFFKRADDLDLVEDIQQLLNELIEYVVDANLPTGHVSRPGFILTLAREQKNMLMFREFADAYGQNATIALESGAFEDLTDHIGEFLKEAQKASSLLAKVKKFSYLLCSKLITNSDLLLGMKDPGTLVEVLANDLGELKEAQNITYNLMAFHTAALFDVDSAEVEKIIDVANRYSPEYRSWESIARDLSAHTRNEITPRNLDAVEALQLGLGPTS